MPASVWARLPWGAGGFLAAEWCWPAAGCGATCAAAAWRESVRAVAAPPRSDWQRATTAGQPAAGEECCSVLSRKHPKLLPCKYQARVLTHSIKINQHRSLKEFQIHLLWLVSVGASCCRVRSNDNRLRQHCDKKRNTGSRGRTERSSSLDTALSSPAAMLSETTPNLVWDRQTHTHTTKTPKV